MYTMASTMVAHHGYEWSKAIELSEKVVKNSMKGKGRGKGKGKRKKFAFAVTNEDSDDCHDDAGPALDIVPYR